MKIAYLMDAGAPNIRQRPLSGPASHVWYICKELQALGHSVDLLTRQDGQLYVASPDFTQLRLLTVNSIDKGPLRLLERLVRRIQSELNLPYIRFFESLRFALACRQVLSDYDILYERMGWMGYGGAIASKLLHIPLVWEVNGDHLDEFQSLGIAPQGLQRQLSLLLMKWATKQASLVIATGEGWRKRFLERWETPQKQVVVVENGSHLVEILPREKLQTFQPLSSTDNKPLTIAYLGALEPWHGVDVLLRSFERAQQEIPGLRLIVIGDGSERARLEHLTAQLDLETHVSFLGFLSLEKAAQWLSSAEIGVSPYCGRVEFSGLKLLDYKAAGLATIASGENGSPSVLRHGHTGWIVPPCNTDALAEALILLAQQPGLRRSLGQNARLEAEDIHSWRYTASQIAQLLLTVVERSGKDHNLTRNTQSESYI